MKVKLTKLKSNSATPLRTKEVEGLTDSLPVIGQRFEMLAEGLSKGSAARFISTSPVMKMEGDIFTTVFSKYRIVKIEVSNDNN